MHTLQVSPKNARLMYATAPSEIKTMLVDTFGDKFFSDKKIDRIKTFEDACEEMGINPNDSNFSIGTTDEIALKKIKVVRNALNPKGWMPDWNNGNQRKWAPWFYMDSPGFRFYGSFYVISYSYSTGGSRLCFESEELSNYAGKQFLELYKAWLS